MNFSGKIDYLVIGHICHDITPAGLVTGGTAAYSGNVAQVFGCETAVLTSSAPQEDWTTAMPGCLIHNQPAENTTTFENIYTPTGRVQTIHALADRLIPAHLPTGWQHAAVVHLGPIANEVDPDLLHSFPNSVIGFTPQGWMRRWNADGRVYARDWEAAEHYLPLATAVVLSEEDLLDDDMLTRYRAWSKLLVLTQGPLGCTVFWDDETRQIPVSQVVEREPTGAGDIFAATFFWQLHYTNGNPYHAARIANEVAAQSITVAGMASKMGKIRNSQGETHFQSASHLT